MKKIVMIFMAAMMMISLAACTPTTEKNKTAKQTEAAAQPTTAVDRSQLANSVDRERGVDSTAPALEVVAIYAVNNKGTRLECTMESVEEDNLSAETLAELLIQYGVLEEGTEVIDFDTDNELTSEQAAGPGASNSESVISANGIVNLSAIPDDGKDDLIVHAIARTFMENLNVESLTVQLNGETVAENLTIADVE